MTSQISVILSEVVWNSSDKNTSISDRTLCTIAFYWYLSVFFNRDELLCFVPARGHTVLVFFCCTELLHEEARRPTSAMGKFLSYELTKYRRTLPPLLFASLCAFTHDAHKNCFSFFGAHKKNVYTLHYFSLQLTLSFE